MVGSGLTLLPHTPFSPLRGQAAKGANEVEKGEEKHQKASGPRARSVKDSGIAVLKVLRWCFEEMLSVLHAGLPFFLLTGSSTAEEGVCVCFLG